MWMLLMQETNLDNEVINRLWLLCLLACHPIIFFEQEIQMIEQHKVVVTTLGNKEIL